MSITSNYYGRTKAGAEIYQYTLENANGMKVCVIEYGCVITNIWVPDSAGNLRDVVLGYRELADYEAGTASLGSFVGRYANRIEQAKFTLHGKTYYLEPNNGPNHLHGTFGRLTYQGSIVDDSLVLTGRSPDGDDGFPGNMDITVTYKLTDDDALVMDYTATTDKATVINLTNHSYFNLDGCDGGDVLRQQLWLDADRFTEGNAETCPTGRILPVQGTPMDFTKFKAIGQDLFSGDEQLRMAGGYDHNFVLNKEGGMLALGAIAKSPSSGICMEMYTTQPGVQLYTGNFLNEDQVLGKNGKHHTKYQAFCLETQHFPCTPSHPDFPPVTLEPDQEYHETTVYQFKTE
ncbi:aldose epimerase family protein [uncultured Ruthenibacterium sp.]|uniref:aldose epimerase family protein n=1 Tax=uncultured Ruthenibacterium sp. TaxID=1905347 RepID=UPI00349E907C